MITKLIFWGLKKFTSSALSYITTMTFATCELAAGGIKERHSYSGAQWDVGHTMGEKSV